MVELQVLLCLKIKLKVYIIQLIEFWKERKMNKCSKDKVRIALLKQVEEQLDEVVNMIEPHDEECVDDYQFDLAFKLVHEEIKA